jgi:type I restriction-modification system DNA methylase subunit
MNAAEFVSKWRKAAGQAERAVAQQHFLDLCELVGIAKPAQADPEGSWFTFEKGLKKAGGRQGFADVWLKARFAWEYKKKHRDLDAAFDQLRQYVEALENPPLLVASDIERIVVKTRFNDYPSETFEITLEALDRPKNLALLHNVFHDPAALKPAKTSEEITAEAVKEIAVIAADLRARGEDETRAAHFLARLVFCLFAEDVGILPNDVFSRLVKGYNRDPRDLTRDVESLFRAMAEGGSFWGEEIPHVNGRLFDDTSTVPLRGAEFEVLHRAARRDWSQMDVSIFGTLFERVMNPAHRKKLGAHYTGFRDIQALVEPVLMEPLRRAWDEAREHAESLLFAPAAPDAPPDSAVPPERRAGAQAAVDGFLARLRATRVLDPACGSGNFLYVALKLMKDLEKSALSFCLFHGLDGFDLRVGPHQLFGIETNEYAHDLAQMTVWIGLIQWHRDNGFPLDRRPILQHLDTIQRRDAILDLSDPDHPREPDWPEADVILGNPPFLGGKKLRRELGDADTDALFETYRDRVRPEADLCCYWFEKARAQIEQGRARRAALIATQGIRGGASRETLKRIKASGDIFFAESDRDWVIDGANVHISIIGFDGGTETVKVLDGQFVDAIHSNLAATEADITTAKRLMENACIGYMGDTKGGDLTSRSESRSGCSISRTRMVDPTAM